MERSEKQEFIIRQAPRMAHRIRDELSITQTATDLLINDESIPGQVREKIALIKDHIGHVAGFAWHFLVITDNKVSQRTVLDVRNALAELTSLLQRLLGELHQLEMAVDPDLWPIMADIELFELIVINLVVNARETMPRSGRLRIRATNLTKAGCDANPETAAIAADYALIEVVDTGIGIAKSDADRIFEPFFSAKGAGCGFGLATVYSTIKRLNGHIIVQSRVGKGTMFRIFLPRHVSTVPRPPAAGN